MTDILLGILAVLMGAFLCAGGQWLLKVLIPIWGAFAGFVFGAGLVAGFSEEHFLGTVLGWVLGLVFALVFGLLAYLYYAVGVVLMTAAIGFSLGTGMVAALGIDWNWVAVVSGTILGALFGLMAVLADVPTLILIALTALAGALLMVAGFMLITGVVDSADLTRSTTTSQVQDDWWWWVTFVVLALGGGFIQASNVAAVRGSMRYDAAAFGH
jgi:hypothetical protein